MASVHRRKTAKGFRWDVRYRGADGRAYSETWKTAEDAKRRKAELEVELVSGDWVTPNAGLTVVDLWDRWIIETKTGLSESTRVGLDATRKALTPLHDHPVQNLKRTDIAGWVKTISAKSSPATVHKRLSALRGALEWGVREHLLRTNPATGIQGPRVVATEPVFLSAQELEALADAIDPRYRLWVLVAGWTGLRFAELAGLRWRDIDPARATITVSGQVARKANGGVERRTTKTRRSRRTVVMPARVARLLEAQRGAPNASVFTAPEGGLLSGPGFTKRFFKPAAAKIGRPEMTPHDCRHTAASLAIAAGASVSEVMHLLGHTTSRLTLDLYGHLAPEAGADLARKMDALYAATDDVGAA